MSVSCFICDNRFKNKNSLAAHISKYHAKQEDSVKEPRTQTATSDEGDRCYIYSSTCPAKMLDPQNANARLTVGVDKPNQPHISKNLKRNRRKRNYKRIQHKKFAGFERDDRDLLTSIKIDLQNYISKSPQPLGLLTSFGIRRLFFKRIGNGSEADGRHENFTNKQSLFVNAVLSLPSLDDVQKLLNENMDMLMQIIVDSNYTQSVDIQ